MQGYPGYGRPRPHFRDACLYYRRYRHGCFLPCRRAITSIMANPMSDVLAEKAIALVCEYLPKAVTVGSDIEARTNMSFAATIAGYAFGDAIPHYGHAIGHTLGSIFRIPHGNACGIALPEVMEFIVDEVPDKVKRVGIAMGLDISSDLSSREIGKKVAHAIRELNREIGLKTLKAHKIEESALSDAAKMVLTDDIAGFSPKKANDEDILNMLKRACSL